MTVQKVEVFKKTFKKGDATDKSNFSLLVPFLISHQYLKINLLIYTQINNFWSPIFQVI